MNHAVSIGEATTFYGEDAPDPSPGSVEWD
jgi:hypothetical protein